MQIQNIFGNKQASSRDIAAHFSAIEHLRFVCEGGCYNDQMKRFVHGIVSAKRDLVHIIKFVIKMPYV